MAILNKEKLEMLIKSVNLNIEMCRRLDPYHVNGGRMHISHDDSAVEKDDEYKTFYAAFEIPYPGENLFRYIFYDTAEFAMRSNERDALNDRIKLETVDDDNVIPQSAIDSLIERSPIDSMVVSLKINTRLYEENIRESIFNTYADYIVDEDVFYFAPNTQRLIAHLVKDETMYHPFPTDLWMKLVDLAEEIYKIGVRDKIYYTDYEVQLILILILLGFADATINIYPVSYTVTGYDDNTGFEIDNIHADRVAEESTYRSSANDETVNVKFDKDMLKYIKKMKGID